METWDLVEKARYEMADFGDSLSEEQWDLPTLCPEWRVRHVFAHIAITSEGSIRALLPALVRSGFRPTRALALSAITMGDRDSAATLVSELRRVAHIRKVPGRIDPAGFIADVLVHTQDIRRSLGLAWHYDEESLARALDASLRAPSAHGIQKRINGLHLEATDIDWSNGEGEAVEAPGEALLMTMWGRSAALPDVAGPGAATFAARFEK